MPNELEVAFQSGFKKEANKYGPINSPSQFKLALMEKLENNNMLSSLDESNEYDEDQKFNSALDKLVDDLENSPNTFEEFLNQSAKDINSEIKSRKEATQDYDSNRSSSDDDNDNGFNFLGGFI